MSTPAYAIKKWWRAARRPGESLKAFAYRHAGQLRDGKQTTSAQWLARKGKSAAAWAATVKLTVAGVEMGPPMRVTNGASR